MATQAGGMTKSVAYTKLDGGDGELALDTIAAFRARARGDVVLPGEPGYDDARRIWNGSIDHRPALVARCRSSTDVRAAVDFARTQSMLLSVRGGGHHIAGNAIAEGGLAIDLSFMRGVHVDAERRRARIEGGALLGDVDHETQSFGLAVPVGINSTTGFGGLCLGGGFGWLTRKYGMTIDNLVSADVVTADGALHVVSSTREPDLFWAIRGGGGNFGVVTSFEVQLHPVGPIVHGGLIVYPGAEAREVLQAWRNFSETAPDEVSAWTVLRKAPPLPFLAPEIHGTDVVIVVALYTGDAANGPAVTAPLTKLGTPIAVMLGPQPFVAFQQSFDPLLAPGARNYWKSSDFEELDDEALDLFVDVAHSLPGPECEVFLAMLGGAMARVPSDATAYSGRNAMYVMNVHGRWRDEAEDTLVRDWARGVFQRVAPFATTGGYVNFLTEDEAGRVATAYGGNYERLQEVKQEVDPQNLFRMNHNILPRAPAARVRHTPARPGAGRAAPRPR